MVKCLLHCCALWVMDAWTHCARPKCPRAQTHVVRLLSRQKKKLASSNLYIKQSIFRVTIKLRTLPFLQSFRSFNLIEILAVTRNRRPRQRLLFAVQQFFPWTALTQRRLHRESTSSYSIIKLVLKVFNCLLVCEIYFASQTFGGQEQHRAGLRAQSGLKTIEFQLKLVQLSRTRPTQPRPIALSSPQN